MKVIKSFPWIVANNAKTVPLHIADSGTRFSTLTGIKWLNDKLFVVNHRSGLKMAIFDIESELATPISQYNLHHLTDDIDAKSISADIYEIAVSGCWDAHYSVYTFDARINKLSHVKTEKKINQSFVHGVTYSPHGDLILGIHAGKDPRISRVTDNKTWRLPSPWGVRKVIFDETNIFSFYAIAVSSNPKLSKYNDAATSIWQLKKRSDYLPLGSKFKKIGQLDSVHSDCACIFNSHLYLLDQKGNSLIKIKLPEFSVKEVFKHPSIDFPHGISINSRGTILISNYGNSEVTIIEEI